MLSDLPANSCFGTVTSFLFNQLFAALSGLIFISFLSTSSNAGEVYSLKPNAKTNWREIQYSKGDRLLSTRFYLTWSGHQNPPRPQKRVDLIQAHNFDVYYEFIYEKINKHEVLVQFKKYRLQKKPTNIPDSFHGLNDKYFLMIDNLQGCSSSVLRSLSPEEVVKSTKYVFLPRGSPNNALCVKKSLIANRSFLYDENGVYVDFKDLFPKYEN